MSQFKAIYAYLRFTLKHLIALWTARLRLLNSY